jgi:transposase
VVGERRLHSGAGAPARFGHPKQAEHRRRKRGVEHPSEEALGRGRDGFSTKVHLSCDGKGRPLSVVVTPGQRNDGTQLSVVLDSIRVPRAGRGRPRKCPDHLLADRGYGKGVYRRMLRARAIPHTIPERSDHRERRAKRPGRPPTFEADLYAKRNVVERCVNRLKQWRCVALRYEKRALNYKAMVVIASLMIWLAS